jgi:hypothetical protein
MRSIKGTEDHFSMGAGDPTSVTPIPAVDGAPLCLRTEAEEGTEKLRAITAVRLVGYADAHVGEVMLKHGMFSDVYYSDGTIQLGDHDVRLVVTETGGGEPKAVLRAKPVQPQKRKPKRKRR